MRINKAIACEENMKWKVEILIGFEELKNKVGNCLKLQMFLVEKFYSTEICIHF
jgi:hypothetical protein